MPEALIFEFASGVTAKDAATSGGGFIVLEVWDSQAQPTRVEWLSVAGNIQP